MKALTSPEIQGINKLRSHLRSDVSNSNYSQKKQKSILEEETKTAKPKVASKEEESLDIQECVKRRGKSESPINMWQK